VIISGSTAGVGLRSSDGDSLSTGVGSYSTGPGAWVGVTCVSGVTEAAPLQAVIKKFIPTNSEIRVWGLSIIAPKIWLFDILEATTDSPPSSIDVSEFW
jgi:hypothetical protein